MLELKSLQQTLLLIQELSIDIRCADDTTLIAAIFEKPFLSTKELEKACNKWGMKVNPDKCKITSSSTSEVQLDGKIVEKVESFTSLGSTTILR